MSKLRGLIANLSPRRRGFDPSLVHVGFEVDELALGQVLPRTLQSSPVDINPSVLLNGISFLSHRFYTAETTSLYTTILRLPFTHPVFLKTIHSVSSSAKHRKQKTIQANVVEITHTHTHTHTHIYIYICVCVCVCVSFYLISSLVLR